MGEPRSILLLRIRCKWAQRYTYLYHYPIFAAFNCPALRWPHPPSSGGGAGGLSRRGFGAPGFAYKVPFARKVFWSCAVSAQVYYKLLRHDICVL